MNVEILIVAIVALIILGAVFRKLIALAVVIGIALVLYYLGFFDVLIQFMSSTLIKPISITIGG